MLLAAGHTPSTIAAITFVALLALPADAWAIADYAMDEHLVPVLMGLPMDGAAHPIHVYRPTPGRWDHGTALVSPREGVRLVVLRMEGGTARRARLDAVLSRLQAAQPSPQP